MEIIIRQYKDPFINQISISWFMECQGFVSRCSNDYPSRSNPTPPPICKICSSKLDTFTLGRGENHPPEMYQMFFFFFRGICDTGWWQPEIQGCHQVYMENMPIYLRLVFFTIQKVVENWDFWTVRSQGWIFHMSGRWSIMARQPTPPQPAP